MPEDVLTYKVEVDAADLPQQLEQLRSQMDMALGSMAFGNAPPPPEMTQGPMNFMFNAAPDLGHQQMIDATSQGFLATQQGMAQAEGGGLMNFLNSNVEAFRLGYSKFHGGMERMGLMVPPSPLVQFPMQGMSAYGEQMQHLEQLGLPGGPLFTSTGMEQAAAHMPGLIAGTMGLGYDPNTMPMSRFEFNEAYGASAAKRTRDFFEGNAGAIGGAAIGGIIGAAGGPLGVIGGATIGMAGDMVLGWAGGRRRQEEQVGKALQRITQRGTAMKAGFSDSEGADFAGELLGQADSYEARINSVTRDSIQSQLLDFTKAGGFESTATADEFKATAQGVIDNTRKIMQTLRMTQEEATSFMAEMNREGLMTTADSGNFAMGVAANAKVAGLDPTMMLNEMRAGSEMFRGSAYEMGGGMQMLMDARLTTQQMLQTAPGGVDIIRELGGIQQASMGLAQNNANFMQTGMGMLAYNNAQAGGASNDTLAMLGNAAGMSPFDWYAQRAKMAKDVGSGEISQQDIAGFRLDPILNMYSQQFKRTEGRGMGVDDMEGFFQFTTQAGFTDSVAEAKQLFSTRFQDPEEGTQRNIQALNLQLDKMRQPEPVSWLQKMSAQLGEIGEGIAQPFRALEGAIHEAWDPWEKTLGDMYLDRERYTLDTTTHTSNELQAEIAKRSGKGQLNTEESEFLTRIKKEYLTHIETTGEMSEDRYLKTVQEDVGSDPNAIKAAWEKREDKVKDAVVARIPSSYLYGDGAPTSLTNPSILAKGYTVPTAFSSYAGDALVSELFGKGVTEYAGIDISMLEGALGGDFEWGKISSDFSLSKRGTAYPELTGGANWGDADISGIDSLIIGMMQAEGTLTMGGELGNSSGLTRGNHNSNPINIRAPHTAAYTDLVQAHQRDEMQMKPGDDGWGNLGKNTLKSMMEHGEYDPELFYNLDKAQFYWDGVEGIDDLGFVKFQDYESGMTAARQQVLVAATEGLSINQYLNKHAPGFENDVGNVINTVTSRLFKHVGPGGIADSTLNHMNAQNLITTPIKTFNNAPLVSANAGVNVYDLATAIDPANADRGAVESFQEAYMGMQAGDPGWGNFGKATTAKYQEVMKAGADAFVTAPPKISPNVNQSNANDNMLLLTPIHTGDVSDTITPWTATANGVFRLLNQNDIDLLTGKAADSGESIALGADYVKTLTSMFAGDDAPIQASLLTEFVLSMGGTEENKGSLTGALVELGLVNVSSDAQTQAEESLFLEERAMDMYSTFILPTATDMRKKGALVRKDLTAMNAIKENQTALDNIQVDFEGAQIKALDIATDIMHNKGLLQNTVDVNKDGRISFSDVQGADMGSVRDFLYTGNKEAYEDLFMDMQGGTSVKEDVIAAGGKANYRKLMMGQFYDKGTKSFDVQALEWFIDDTQNEIDSFQEVYELDEASKASLLEKSPWYGETSNVETENNPYYWKQIVGGTMIAGGLLTSWTGLGVGLVAGGVTLAAGDAIEDMSGDSNATHLGKLLNVAYAEDAVDGKLDIFSSKYKGEGAVDFRTLAGPEQLEIFKKMVLDHDLPYENAFIDHLKTISGEDSEGRAMWDATTDAYINDAITAAEGLRDQNQATIDGKAGRQTMLNELNLAKGIRAGLSEKKNYKKFGGDGAGTDLSTFEQIQNIKSQITDEKEQLAVDAGSKAHLSDIIKDVTRGVSTANYLEGEGDKDSKTYIMSYEEWSGEAGKGKGGMPTAKQKAWKDKGGETFEDYVHHTRLTQGAVEYGGGYLTAVSDLESGNGLYDKALRTQDDERALEKKRNRDAGKKDDADVYAEAGLNRFDIAIQLLEDIKRNG